MRRMKWMVLALGLWIALVAPEFAMARGAASIEQDWDLKRIGSAEYQWMWFDLYDAELWADQQPLAAEDIWKQRFALKLFYKTDFSGPTLLQATMDQLNRFGNFSESQKQRWEKLLQPLLPDVQQGSMLAAVYRPSGSVSIYDDQQELGKIQDPQLARLFLSIWLDPRAKFQSQRLSLLNLAETDSAKNYSVDNPREDER